MSSLSSPKVCVLMSVFNGQEYLPEAIESILQQTYADYEFVVIDDGSADGTAEILEGYAARDRRICVHHHENRGRAASLNIGMELTKCSYIARMDADDIALRNRLEDQVEFMEKHPEVGLLGGGVELMSSRGKVLATYRPSLLEDGEIRDVMMHRNTFYHPAVMMRKEVAIAAGGYRKALLDADDYDLWLRMGERSQFANVSQTIVKYRIHGNQVSVRNMRQQTLCVLAAQAAARERRRGRSDPLSQVEKVTPETLEALGVTVEEVGKTLWRVYMEWMEFLPEQQPEAALGVIDGIVEVFGAGIGDRPSAANALLAAAAIHYRQGRPLSALASAGRAVMIRPIIAGRPIKRAWVRLVRS